MSVNSTVANNRSGSTEVRDPVRNFSTSSKRLSLSPTNGEWSIPANSTYFAPGMFAARSCDLGNSVAVTVQYQRWHPIAKIGRSDCSSALVQSPQQGLRSLS